MLPQVSHHPVHQLPNVVILVHQYANLLPLCNLQLQHHDHIVIFRVILGDMPVPKTEVDGIIPHCIVATVEVPLTVHLVRIVIAPLVLETTVLVIIPVAIVLPAPLVVVGVVVAAHIVVLIMVVVVVIAKVAIVIIVIEEVILLMLVLLVLRVIVLTGASEVRI